MKASSLHDTVHSLLTERDQLEDLFCEAEGDEAIAIRIRHMRLTLELGRLFATATPEMIKGYALCILERQAEAAKAEQGLIDHEINAILASPYGRNVLVFACNLQREFTDIWRTRN